MAATAGPRFAALSAGKGHVVQRDATPAGTNTSDAVPRCAALAGATTCWPQGRATAPSCCGTCASQTPSRSSLRGTARRWVGAVPGWREGERRCVCLAGWQGSGPGRQAGAALPPPAGCPAAAKRVLAPLVAFRSQSSPAAARRAGVRAQVVARRPRAGQRRQRQPALHLVAPHHPAAAALPGAPGGGGRGCTIVVQ